MLHDGNKMQAETMAGMGLSPTNQKCKMDYEGAIKRLRDKKEKSALLRDALLHYFEGMRAGDAMAVLIGEVVTDCNAFDYEIAALIKRQEEDK
jgi:hypothetical protein